LGIRVANTTPGIAKVSSRWYTYGNAEEQGARPMFATPRLLTSSGAHRTEGIFES
jgi:hypothetical protein